MFTLIRILANRILVIILLVAFNPVAIGAESITVNSGKYQTSLLELYTSEGCSSCPPADRWFNQLLQTPTAELNVLALAFHVDYWDYIGWKDRFANPVYTNRQRHLARRNNQSSIYTPEFFVNGLEARGTSSVVEKIQTSNKKISPVKLELTLQQDKDRILLKLASHVSAEQELMVRFVVFENDLTSDVKRGENAGRKLHHQQVVRYLSPKTHLQTKIDETIEIKPEWNVDHLGVAAMINTTGGKYVQSVSSLLNKQ